jgi:cytochrome c-type biogenesis protein CcmH/NrfG
MESPADTAPQAEGARPGSAVEWATLGQRQLQEGSVDAAIVSFQSATLLDSSNAEHWLRLGRAQAAKWQHEAAESALQRACSRTRPTPRSRLASAPSQRSPTMFTPR